MKLTHLSTVSALALMLAIGAPATAQVTADQPADEPTVGTTQPADEPEVGVTAPAGPEVGVTDSAQPQVAEDPEVTPEVGDRMTLADLHDAMEQMGVEDPELFGGQIVVAHTAEGDPIIIAMGPEDFERGAVAAMEMEDFDQLRDRLTEAGFDHVNQDHAFQVLQGTLNGHYVFATSGEPAWDRDVVAGLGVSEPRDDMAERDIGEPTGDMAERDIGEPTGDMAERDIGVSTDDLAERDIGEPTGDMAERDTGVSTDDLAERDIGEPTGDMTGEFGIGETEPGVDTAEPGITEEPGIHTAEPGVAFDRDQFEQTLEQAGIEDRSDFQGKLVRGRTEDGQTFAMLVGPEHFAGGEEIELTEDELRQKLEDAGLTEVEFVEQDVAMVRGTYNGQSMLIMGGRGLLDDPMRVGAGPDAPETGVTEMEPETGVTEMEQAE